MYKKIVSRISILIICLLICVITGNNTEIAFNEDYSGPIFRVNTEEKVVALTFDVNWAEKENIYRILEILDKYNVKGTFFIMGKWANESEENIEKVKKIKEAGHEIGNHSYKHPSFTKIGEAQILEELQKTDKIIEEITGEKTNLFRFPSGDYDKRSFEVLKKNGYVCIQWDADSVDWKELGAQVEYDRVMKRVKNGSILLFHNNAKYTPENLEKIIPELQSQGYEFKLVSDMIYKNDYYINEQGEQFKK